MRRSLATRNTHRSVVRGALVALATVVFMLLVASPARASDSTPADTQYGAVLGEQAGGGPGGAATGGLPFTGLNLLLVLGAGTGLAAGGLAVRRVARPRPS